MSFRLRPGFALASLLLVLAGTGAVKAADAAAESAAAPVVDEAEAAAIAEARDNINISGGWTRATPGNATNAAVYLRIANSGMDEERLIGVRAAMADRVEMHSAAMIRQENMVVPGENALEFAPNGNHIMLIDLRAPLNEGDSFLVQLEFERGGTQTASVQIAAPNAMGPPAIAAAAPADITSGVTPEP